MKKSNVFLLIGALLVAIAFLFIGYALSHGGSFPWSIEVTYILYGVYLAVTGAMLLLSLHFGHREGGASVAKRLLTIVCLCLTGLLIAFLAYLISCYHLA